MNVNKTESKKTVKTSIYPFINEMVDTFYTEDCNSMIERAIDNDSDKSVFLMFIMMYFGIHLKLEKENDDFKKNKIKLLMTDLIRDPEKRKYCIEMFESKFHSTFFEGSNKEVVNSNKLLLKNKEDNKESK